ncbi:phospho-sugar mutase [Mycoplasma todarodis]|nr:phospho-sugar mutase [Mycoplasma todarodis]
MELKFGTAGVRGIIGSGNMNMNKTTVQKVSFALAKVILEKGNEDKKCVIGYDNRNMSLEFAEVAGSVFEFFGIKTFIFEDISPTPLVSYAIRKMKCDFGVMITASHNPKEYNGYKAYDSTGCQILPTFADKVQSESHTWEYEHENPIEIKELEKVPQKIINSYLKRILKTVGPQAKPTIKIAYSPLHGTGYKIVPKLLKTLGYEFYEDKTQNFKSISFENTKSCNPEHALAFEGVKKVGQQNKTDLIMVTDPDADRVGVGVLKDGEYILLDGNETGTIVFDFLAKRIKEVKLKKEWYMLYSFVSTDLPKAIARKHNINVIELATGFKWIGNFANKIEAEGNKFLFGFEESYGSLYTSKIGRDKDAIQSIVLIAKIADFYKKQGKTLLDVYEEIQKEHYFTKMKMNPIKIKPEITFSISELMKKARKIKGVKEIVDFNNKEAEEVKGNMIKIMFEDESWIAVRPSGTEPIIKVYINAKSKDKNDLLKRFNEIQNISKKLI